MLDRPRSRVLGAVCVVRVERHAFSVLLTPSSGRQRLGHAGSDQWVPSYFSRGPSSVGLGFEAQGGGPLAVAHSCTLHVVQWFARAEAAKNVERKQCPDMYFTGSSC